MKEIDIQFVDELPPKATGGRTTSPILDAVTAALKARPGEWAIVLTAANSGHTSRFRDRGLATATRNTRTVDGKKVVDIYARWPAPAEAQA